MKTKITRQRLKLTFDCEPLNFPLPVAFIILLYFEEHTEFKLNIIIHKRKQTMLIWIK